MSMFELLGEAKSEAGSDRATFPGVRNATSSSCAT